jgi:glutaredoxin
MGRILAAIATALLVGIMLLSGDGAEPHVSAPDGDVPKLFVNDRCGSSCDRMRQSLGQRFDFEEYDALDNGDGASQYTELGGKGHLPYTVIGDSRIVGSDPGAIISAIAIEYGDWQLLVEERDALARHFDETGEPLFVMYSTSACGYCEKARAYLANRNIEFVEFDIELDADARRDYDILMGHGTPLIYRGYERVPGFNIRQLEPLIDAEEAVRIRSKPRAMN